MTLLADAFDSPLGALVAAVDGAGRLAVLEFAKGRDPERLIEEDPELARRPRALGHVRRELREYFGGRRRRFDLVVAPRGTAFQQEVWAALQEIPFGRTWSYARLARRVGRPGAARAVGGANGANPVAVVIPCHRVIGQDGTLTGYGGGLPSKRYLLELEGALPARQGSLFA